MKNKILGLAAFLALSLAAIPEAMTPVYQTNLANETALGYSKRYVLDLGTLQIDYLAFTETLSSASLNTATFTDGTASTGSINITANSGFGAVAATDTVTISNTNFTGVAATDSVKITATLTQMLGTPATNQITISSFNAAGTIGSTVTIRDTFLVNGRDWFTTDTATGTATSLATAINGVSGFTAQAISTVVFTTATATINGSYGNTYRLVSSTPLAIAVATNPFNGGIDSIYKTAFLTFNGQVLDQGSDWFVMQTVTDTAKSIANALAEVPGVATSFASSIAFATATSVGSYANSFTLTSSTPTLVVSGPVFTGGADPLMRNAFITLNGVKLRNGYEWSDQGTATGTASSLATAMALISGVTAQANSTLITATATTKGAAANSFTLTASTGAITFGSATFTNGQDTAAITINGIVLTNGVQWATGADSSSTARNISNAIQANTSLAAIILSTWNASGVVGATSTAVGTGVNYLISKNSPSITISSASGMTGGTASAINTTNKSINIANHGYGTGTQLVYAKSAGTNPANLIPATTYFAVVTDANNFQLALTLANSTATTPTIVSISTQLATGGGSFTLTPLAINGTSTLQWQVSNDNVNWFNTTAASVTFASPFTSTSTAWDLGLQDFRYLGLNVVGPTTGGIVLKVVGNGKRQNP